MFSPPFEKGGGAGVSSGMPLECPSRPRFSKGEVPCDERDCPCNAILRILRTFQDFAEDFTLTFAGTFATRRAFVTTVGVFCTARGFAAVAGFAA